jgi:hypothetical protein
MSIWWATHIPDCEETDDYDYEREDTIVLPVSSKKELVEKINLFFENNGPYRSYIDYEDPPVIDRTRTFLIRIYNAELGRIDSFDIMSQCIRDNFGRDYKVIFTVESLKKCKCVYGDESSDEEY